MNTTSFDPERYKTGQRQEWNSVATGWRKWWPIIEARTQKVSDRFMELAGIGENQVVLDVATGIGEPSLTAARRVGPGGKVVATDPSEGMLQIASDRAAEAGLPNVEFLNLDAGGLSFGEGAFDAATCRWGLMFVPDLRAALQGIRQTLKPGGKFVSTVWGPPEKAVGIALPMGVVKEMLNLPPPPPDAPNFFKLSPPGVLEGALTDAGFMKVQGESMMIDFEFDGVQDYLSFLQEVSAPITMMLSDQPAEKVAAVWEGIATAAGKFVGEDGHVRLPSKTIVAVGER
ncbi:MAG: class I SAM-dependent methyltransferase [Candidatus Marinimicrobia bacterium]|nr:class I SAM-dependent methyltransferase [Candidatus Neomarinimicrobiota bacterium]